MKSKRTCTQNLDMRKFLIAVQAILLFALSIFLVPLHKYSEIDFLGSAGQGVGYDLYREYDESDNRLAFFSEMSDNRKRWLLQYVLESSRSNKDLFTTTMFKNAGFPHLVPVFKDLRDNDKIVYTSIFELNKGEYDYQIEGYAITVSHEIDYKRLLLHIFQVVSIFSIFSGIIKLVPDKNKYETNEIKVT